MGINKNSSSSDVDGDPAKGNQEASSSGGKPASAAAGSKDEQAESSFSSSCLEYIQSLITEKLHLHGDDEPKADSGDILNPVNFEGVMKKWKSNGFKNIITMVGAGISTCM